MSRIPGRTKRVAIIDGSMILLVYFFIFDCHISRDTKNIRRRKKAGRTAEIDPMSDRFARLDEIKAPPIRRVKVIRCCALQRNRRSRDRHSTVLGNTARNMAYGVKLPLVSVHACGASKSRSLRTRDTPPPPPPPPRPRKFANSGRLELRRTCLHGAMRRYHYASSSITVLPRFFLLSFVRVCMYVRTSTYVRTFVRSPPPTWHNTDAMLLLRARDDECVSVAGFSNVRVTGAGTRRRRATQFPMLGARARVAFHTTDDSNKYT